MKKVFDLLKEGLKEAILYEKGHSKNTKAKKIQIDTYIVLGSPKEDKNIKNRKRI